MGETMIEPYCYYYCVYQHYYYYHFLTMVDDKYGHKT